MALPAAKLEAPAPNRGLLIWWQPARIAVHRNGRWQTYPYPNYTPVIAAAKGAKSVALSPIDTDGLTWFTAWDVDNGNPKDVATILRALPAGATPLVSASGKKGWHVWCFFDQPLPVQTAVSFAGLIRERAGIPCEIFPSSKRSRCLKWLGQKHPETGKREVFVHEDDLTGEYDTEAMLNMLAQGYYRTPAEVVENYAKQHGKAAAKKQDSPVDTTWTPRGDHKAQTKPSRQVQAAPSPQPLPGEAKLVRSLDELAKREELAHALMRLAGRRPVPLGKAFRCILPGHEERHPSGSFFRAKDGHILYGDFHARDGEATYTLGEVYHALATGQTAKLKPHDKARWLAMLGLRCGFANELVLRQREKTKAAAAVLASLQQDQQAVGTQQDASTPSCDSPCPTGGYYSSGCSPKGDWLAVLKVREAVAEEAEIQAMGGFEEIGLSARFLAGRAKVKVELANKAVNLLCCLGLLEKVPNSGGIRGDRFTLGNVGFEEAKRRFEALFPNGQVDLRAFKRELVAAKLGPELAAAVFRRGAEALVAASVEICNQSCNQSGGDMPPLPLPEAARDNLLIAAIRQAEREGNRERADALLYRFAAWLAAGRPENVAAYLQGGCAR